MNKKDKIIIIGLVIAFLGFLLALIFTHSYKGLIIFFIVGVILLGGYLLSIYLDFSDEIKNNKIKKHYHKLEQKEIKTIYDELFINAFTNQLVLLLKEDFNRKKIKNINNLSCYINSINEIWLNFNYQKHYVNMVIFNEKITYQINTPEEYDILETNKVFEQKRNIDVLLNINDSFSIFLDFISNIVLDILEDIDKFQIENKVDPFFNGKILEKFDASTSYFKTEGIVCTVGGILLFPIFIYITFIAIRDTQMKLDNPFSYYLGIIFCMASVILIIGVLMYGLNYLFKHLKMVKDIKLKRMTKICKVPKRVRLIYDQPGKYTRTRTLRYIKLNYDNIKLLIPLKYPIPFYNVNKHELYKKLLSIKTEIRYLTKSKLVVQGGSRYIKTIKEHLR